MSRESLAQTCVQRAAEIRELFTTLMLPTYTGDRVALMLEVNRALDEIERVALTRMDRSEYEYQRRNGKELAHTLRVTRQLRAEA